MISYDLNTGKYDFINQYFKNSNWLIIRISAQCTGYTIQHPNGDIEYFGSNDIVENNYKRACDLINERYPDFISINDKECLIKYFEDVQEPSTARNRMGCSENWYDPFYAIEETFTKDEIEAMSDNEINNLFRLAGNIQEGLY